MSVRWILRQLTFSSPQCRPRSAPPGCQRPHRCSQARWVFWVFTYFSSCFCRIWSLLLWIPGVQPVAHLAKQGIPGLLHLLHLDLVLLDCIVNKHPDQTNNMIYSAINQNIAHLIFLICVTVSPWHCSRLKALSASTRESSRLSLSPTGSFFFIFSPIALLAMFFSLFQLSASNLIIVKVEEQEHGSIWTKTPGLTPAVVELDDLVDTGGIFEPLPLVLSHFLWVASLTIIIICM